ncbi:hypothetical protein Henu3_gp51 [Mycobacterium phage Henu3]|uniref:Uncharacterized protein n=1 Tax=Mycobacterium phage Henu3 TaxID=2492961 RepID=A0A410T7N3_9CAUD|nr:hypothetical protein I5G68_gp48 [Mycobacterium phage Henu3]QAU04994.1 hypothetical protein Henu3_gp51 [Mycobacterium phage Henu3]
MTVAATAALITCSHAAPNCAARSAAASTTGASRAAQFGHRLREQLAARRVMRRVVVELPLAGALIPRAVPVVDRHEVEHVAAMRPGPHDRQPGRPLDAPPGTIRQPLRAHDDAARAGSRSPRWQWPQSHVTPSEL